ncbi:hypothetical protein [Enterococcus xiangfangensis]|uniref:DOD-type homing endonuclease domain-containing protein n=1 Tax=Enterococcus xiangfangensis TaxID=1296537 RepID=A0ABU3FD61_9ENTE|nr:hypothetical protein [Enterococcus xiangfangensis]MDT2760620.1 hypothetical protein [Enterococcus xiangfangensis]HDT8061707.1 hypothetical protein [Enterococcus faecalis]
MNVQMAYLLGMVLGNGEIQRELDTTKVTIEIPHKNLKDDNGLDVQVYVNSSLMDIRAVIEPLVGQSFLHSQTKRCTQISFTKPNADYVIREIMRFIGGGVNHTTMQMNSDLFNITRDEKIELLRGIADVTGYIRRSNVAYGQDGAHRVYIEIPGNWQFVIDVANLLKSIDVPIQTIDFGHPNFRDPKLKKYNEGKINYWKKEHQLKIFANEFLPIGFNIVHKQKSLLEYAEELLDFIDESKTHKFYWEKTTRIRTKPIHPMENDISLPERIRGKHYDSWTVLAKDLGYGE